MRRGRQGRGADREDEDPGAELDAPRPVVRRRSSGGERPGDPRHVVLLAREDLEGDPGGRREDRLVAAPARQSLGGLDPLRVVELVLDRHAGALGRARDEEVRVEPVGREGRREEPARGDESLERALDPRLFPGLADRRVGRARVALLAGAAREDVEGREEARARRAPCPEDGAVLTEEEERRGFLHEGQVNSDRHAARTASRS